jgi:glycosyltransferase involved in cell wall biosynthesis
MEPSNILISIGMPVYNAQKHLSGSLDSLLAQDFRDFEIIISDNASTDRSGEIAREYAKKDPRVRYLRNYRNFGVYENFNQVFRLSSGRYFMWAGAHDLWSPRFLSTALTRLEENKSAVLCYGITQLIDGNKTEKGYTTDYLDTTGLSIIDGFLKVLWAQTYCNAVYGLIRSDILSQTRLFINSISADNLLLIELSLRGSFIQLPEVLYFRRQGEPNGAVQEERRIKAAGLDRENPFTSYWGTFAFEHMRAIWRSSLNDDEKNICTEEIIRFFKASVYTKDIKIETETVLEHCEKYFVKKDYSNGMTDPAALAMEGLRVLTLLRPFTHEKERMIRAMDLCISELDLINDYPDFPGFSMHALKEFMDECTKLIEAGRVKDAFIKYDQSKSQFPPVLAIKEFDKIINRLKLRFK